MIARNNTDTDTSAPTQTVAADWLNSLSAMVKSLPEFKSVDALLTAVACDDVSGGNMLKWILIYTDAMKRDPYISNADWWQHCRVRRSVIDRVKREIFPMCGVTHYVRFTGRANTTFYNLNHWAFLHRMSNVTGLPMLFLAERCVGIQQNVVSESSRTLTRVSSLKTATDVVNVPDVPKKKILDFKSALPAGTPEQLAVVDLLRKAGIAGNRAVSFATLPEDIVRQCITDAQSAADSGRISHSKRTGYLIGALRNQKQAQSVKADAVPDYKPVFKTEAPPPNPLPVVATGTDGRTWRRPEPATEVVPEVVNPRLDMVINDRGGLLNTPRQVWLAAIKQVELQLDSGTWQTYVSRALLADYADGVWTIQAHNAMAQDMLEHRLHRTIWRLLSDFSGQEVELKFTVAE